MDKYIVGLFDDEEILLKAVKRVRTSGVKIHDVLTPFPVHGLDDAMGLRGTRLHTVGFLFGMTGTTLALSFITWINVSSYPINFGGKPFFSLPSYIPITFEFTVLMASVSMVIAFFARNGFSIFAKPRIFDERITDDRFAITFDMSDENNASNAERIGQLLKESGAVEVKEKDFEASEY